MIDGGSPSKEVNEVQFAKACTPIDVIDDGSPSKEVNEMHALKAPYPIYVIDDGSPSKEVNEVHPQKAPSLMTFTPSATVNDVISTRPLNSSFLPL